LEGGLRRFPEPREGTVPMVDLLIGLAFVAVVLSPAILASLHKGNAGDSPNTRYRELDIDPDEDV